MATHIGVGLSDQAKGFDCGRDAARAACASLPDTNVPITLALLFTSHAHPEQVLKGANAVLGDVPLIGATSVGQYSHHGYVEHGAGVLLIQSEHIRFHTNRYQRPLVGKGRLLGALRGVTTEGLGSAFHHRALMLFPDAQVMNLDEVVDRAMTETGMLYDILGGPSPNANQPPRPPSIFFNRRVFRNGLSAAEVLSQTPLGLALDNGWTPFSGAYRVTHTDAHRILKIDGRPAWEVYEDFLNDHAIAYQPDDLAATTLHYPVGVCENGSCKVSFVMGFDRSGAMLVTAPPPVGRLIHILSTRPDALVTAAGRAVDQARARAQSCAGALFIDCMSTAMVLGDTYAKQRAAVQERLGDVPFLGFRSHGVLSRLQGQTAGHYECSVGTFIFPK
ncbi:MAG: FIST C-terminal domain-containing protein [Chloroflexi bacterium]|nr:FIST C-terminal domain-containing protein [Chloroflexota bacterium]